MLVSETPAEGVWRCTLRPNCSLSWRWVKRLLIALGLCMGAVSGYWVALGAWLVVPFTGLEFLVLGLGFYLCSVAGHSREVIEIEGEDLRVLRGHRRLEEVARFPRHWTRATLSRDPGGWYPSRLVLRCQGRHCEVASRVVETEREALAAELQVWLGLQHARIERREAEALTQGATSPVQHAQREGIWQ
ncbi:MAG TPA: DUF2244 domain-containing protein [Chromatiaceae bacterium]|nr:DUF2244 domain-containing protein [Chromatiaceae bacterium]